MTKDIKQKTDEKRQIKNEKEKKRLKEVIQRTRDKSGASGKVKMLAQIEDIVIDRDDPSLKVSFPEPDPLPPPLISVWLFFPLSLFLHLRNASPVVP